VLYIVPPDALVLENAYQFTVGQVLNVVAALGGTSIGSVTILAIDTASGLVTFTGAYPASTTIGYYLVGLAWPDSSFEVNKMIVSIQAEPMAPIRGAW